MAHNEKNKLDFTTSFGEASSGLGEDEPGGGASDFSEDAPKVPTGGPNNMFPMGGRFGDGPPYNPAGEATGPSDFGPDAAGVPNVNQGEQTDMDMALEGNKFPRETGHDSLTDEEAQLT